MDHTEEKLNLLPGLLLPWYKTQKRDLPWRKTRDPYAVWISEIMLQQTRVDTVIDRYTSFLRALPDIRSLAECDDDRLMKLWEGLGYYSRARNLKKAALQILEKHGGAFPDTYDEILKLPGIGKYTAGAILSIAFGQPVPAVDGNVLRVLSRYLPSGEDIASDSAKDRFTDLLRPVYPGDCSSFTQSLMELGALVCLPNGAPLCGGCPLKGVCHCGITGEWDRYPVKGKKAGRKIEERTVLILRSPAGRTALVRRPQQGLLRGMWALPDLPGHLDAGEILSAVAERYGAEPLNALELPQTKHIFTHIEWRMRPFLIELGCEPEGLQWAAPDELQSVYAVPTAHKKILRLL